MTSRGIRNFGHRLMNRTAVTVRDSMTHVIGWFGYSGRRIPRPLREYPDRELLLTFDDLVNRRRAASSDFFFVQIGAFDGVSGDPIHALVTRHGWRGVLVEPQARYFEQLKQNYAHCDRLAFRRAAIFEHAGTATLHTIRLGGRELPRWAAQLASFDRQVILSHRGSIPDIEERIESEEVECLTFADLLHDYAIEKIDLLQIDVEGYDAQILDMVDLERIKPSIIRFEHKHLTRRVHDRCIRRLVEHGYSILVEQGDTSAYLTA